MEIKLFETKYGGIKIIYHNEALPRIKVILKNNSFTIFITDGLIHSTIPVALPMSTSSFSFSSTFSFFCYVRWMMTIDHYELCANACFCQLWEGFTLKLAESKLMTYWAQITTAAFQKCYRKKLIKFTVMHAGQKTGKCAKPIPKIAPFENASVFSYFFFNLV